MDAGESDERAPYDPMPHGPAEVGVGPWDGPGPRATRLRRASCSPRATGATWSTATATGPARRSSPTSTPGGTASTSRSRTGSTTSTSARWCARPTRSWRPRCTSSAAAAGTGAAPWSPTATSTCGTTARWPTLAAFAAAEGLPLIGIDNLPGAVPLETYELPARCVLLFGQEGPGLTERPGQHASAVLLDRAVRLDPVDQRRGGRRHRHARVDPPVRRPVGRRLARLTLFGG